MIDGTVKWYDKKKGYGFVTADHGQDVFVHYTNLLEKGSVLNDGEAVTFDIVDGEKGPRADKVARKANTTS